MKFREQPAKKNATLILFVVLSLVLISLCFLILNSILYFCLYIVLTIILAYLYFFTYYFIDDDYLILKSGFIKVKIKYSNIISIVENNENIKIVTNKTKFILYPDYKTKFVNELKKKVNKDVSYTIIESCE